MTVEETNALRIFEGRVKGGKAVPSQARCGPEGSRRFKLPDFMTFGT
jgi:hypothetical protein